MVSVLLDSNIIIYLAKDPALAEKIHGSAPSYSAVSAIETLGYTRLSVMEAGAIEMVLRSCHAIGLDEAIVSQAVKLRQLRRMSLGDAIIGATAMVYGLTLWTHNLGDFSWIEELQVVDPLTIV